MKLRRKTPRLTWIMAVLVLLGFAGRVNTCCGTDGGVDGAPVSSSLSLEQNVSLSQLSQTMPCPTLVPTLLKMAWPDECYNGVGNPYPPGPPCSEGIPKVNQTYLWGLAKSGDNLWFGTGANVSCMAMVSSSVIAPPPKEGSSYVCEYGESQSFSGLFPQNGDWRQPKIYVYNTKTGVLTEKTPPSSPLDNRINNTMGFRSAGALGNVVILGGPCLPTGYAGINLFAFRTDTGAYLGSTTLAAYADIRKWRVVNDVLYTAVRNTAGGGSVLRWIGNLANPFQFEEVGKLDSEGVELAEHEGRLFVSTWPEIMIPPPALAGLYMSPLIPSGGLTHHHASDWTKVWQADDYEPDLLMAASYGGGALASFKGYLYWGTMHMPSVAENLFFTLYGKPVDPQECEQVEQRTSRSTSIFRGRKFDTSQREIQLLYGEEKLWKYAPISLDSSKPKWEQVNNRMGGVKPLYGGGGIGNPANTYTWTMAVFHDQLFVGTLDSNWGRSSANQTPTPEKTAGADLFRFFDSNTPAFYEVWDGFGNSNNAGIRTMVAAEDALYIGTAGAGNLLLNPNQPPGWKLIKLTAKPPVPIIDPLPSLIAECGITLTPPTATGNCPGNLIEATTKDPMIYTEPGTYTVTWTYTDGCSYVTQSQQIVVYDTQPPVANLDPLPDITGKGRVLLTPPTAVDSCTGKITATTPDPVEYSLPGTYTVTWTYADGHGNSITRTQKAQVELAVDIKPGVCPNLLNLKSRGTLSVAVLGSAGFDVTSIDPTSIRLGREGVLETVTPIRQSQGDLAALPSDNRGDLFNCLYTGLDGYADLIIDFKSQEVVRKLQLKEVDGEIIPLTLAAYLKADSGGGSLLKGQDYVVIDFPWQFFSKGLSAGITGLRDRTGSLFSNQLWPYQERETDTSLSPYWRPSR